MKRPGAPTILGPRHSVGLMAGVMLTPATPSLVWVALGPNLPLAAIFVALLILAVVPNMLLRIALRTLNRDEQPSDAQPQELAKLRSDPSAAEPGSAQKTTRT
jgi:hypothetical protein